MSAPAPGGRSVGRRPRCPRHRQRRRAVAGADRQCGRGSGGRLTDLLTRLTDAVDEVGEVYTKLVGLSITADLVGVPTDVAGGTAAVSAYLDAVRAVSAKLEIDISEGDGVL